MPPTEAGAAANQWHAILQEDQETETKEPRGAPRGGGVPVDFRTEWWDPLDSFVREYHATLLAPVQDEILGGLEALRDLCDLEEFKHLHSEVTAACFTITTWLVHQVWDDRERRSAFLQKLASVLYFEEETNRIVSAPGFWKFLQTRRTQYTDAVKKAPHTKSLVTVIDSLCSRYGIGGGDNIDVEYGLYRLLSPSFAKAKTYLETRIEAFSA